MRWSSHANIPVRTLYRVNAFGRYSWTVGEAMTGFGWVSGGPDSRSAQTGKQPGSAQRYGGSRYTGRYTRRRRGATKRRARRPMAARPPVRGRRLALGDRRDRYVARADVFGAGTDE